VTQQSVQLHGEIGDRPKARTFSSDLTEDGPVPYECQAPPQSGRSIEWDGRDLILPCATEEGWQLQPEYGSKLVNRWLGRLTRSVRPGLAVSDRILVSLVVSRYPGFLSALLLPDSRLLRGREDSLLGSIDFYRLRPLRAKTWSLIDVVVPGRVLAWAQVRGGDHAATVTLDLPPVESLWGQVVDLFTGTDETQRLHSNAEARTSTFLNSIHTWTTTPKNPSILALETAVAHSDGFDSLRAFASGRRDEVASVTDGFLFVADERDRQWTAQQLAEQEVVFAQPTTLLAGPGRSECEVVDIESKWKPDEILFRDRTQWPDTLTGGYFQSSSGTLWMEDFRFRAALTSHAARLGLPVTRIRWPMVPWTSRLEDIVELSTPRQGRAELFRQGKYLVLLESARQHFQPNLLNFERVRWLERPDVAVCREPDGIFWNHERFVRGRSLLFEGATCRDAAGPCRLCGQTGATFATVLCPVPLTYCRDCLHFAINGAWIGIDGAVRAVRRLADLEFGGRPMMAVQLQRIQNPAAQGESLTCEEVDLRLALRFAVPRSHLGAWGELLEEAGLIDAAGWRPSRGTYLWGADGHRCSSRLEQVVCDFLHLHEIAHEREPLYPPDNELNPKGLRRADWRLADGTFVEMWGFPTDRTYMQKAAEKRKLATALSIQLIELTVDDLPILSEKFARYITPLSISSSRGDDRDLTEEAK
jgi:hypothetical protein